MLYANNAQDCLEFHVINNSPLGYQNPQGHGAGVHWEYLSAIENKADICINKTLLPYPRIWKSIEHGQHDGGIVFKSSTRANFVSYVALIRRVKTIVIFNQGTTVTKYVNLRKLTIGKVRGTHLSEEFDNDPQLNIFKLNNYNQAANMLRLGRIDAIAGSALALSALLKKFDLINKVDLENRFVLGQKEQWLQLSVHSNHLDKIPKLKHAIEQLQQDGSFNQIMDKYYGQQWRTIN